MKTIKGFSTEERRWEAIVQRMHQSDGEFFYGVVTTGIYCRPVCPSRIPNRENVRFFDTTQLVEDDLPSHILDSHYLPGGSRMDRSPMSRST